MEKSYKEKYEQALEVAQETYNTQPMYREWLEKMFPELKESEDERIRKMLIEQMKRWHECAIEDNVVQDIKDSADAITWLEKQGGITKLSEEEQNRFAKCVLRSCAMSFIDYLDAHKYEGKMCVSNGECEDIENAFHNAMWDRLHRYYCKYIEKQGEQKFEMKTAEESLGIDSDTYNRIIDACIYGDDKVKPKFHEGEWITNGDYTWKIVEVKPLDYILQSQDGNIVDDTISHVDEQFHSFTIQDAKDGDVLYINNTLSESIMIYKSFNNGVINKYASYNKFGFEGENYLTLNDGYIVPATKEQRDLLFQKMKEASYEWDADNKELKKVNSYCQENCKGFQETGRCYVDGECKAKREAEQRPTQEIEPFEAEHGKYYYCIKDYFCGGRKQASKGDVIQALRGLPIMGLKDASEYFLPVNFIKCNSAWSEEDSYYRNHIIQIIEEINNAPLKRKEDLEAYINWLKSLRPQNNITDEELAQAKKNAYNDALDKIEYHSGEPTFDDGWSAAIWYLKKRNIQPQPKQEWSEEDENRMKKVMHILSLDGRVSNAELQSIYAWLKSLRPQNRWKPSDEHIRFLQAMVNDPNNASSESCQIVLKDILEKLKKLKEE